MFAGKNVSCFRPVYIPSHHHQHTQTTDRHSNDECVGVVYAVGVRLWCLLAVCYDVVCSLLFLLVLWYFVVVVSFWLWKSKEEEEMRYLEQKISQRTRTNENREKFISRRDLRSQITTIYYRIIFGSSLIIGSFHSVLLSTQNLRACVAMMVLPAEFARTFFSCGL